MSTNPPNISKRDMDRLYAIAEECSIMCSFIYSKRDSYKKSGANFFCLQTIGCIYFIYCYFYLGLFFTILWSHITFSSDADVETYQLLAQGRYLRLGRRITDCMCAEYDDPSKSRFILRKIFKQKKRLDLAYSDYRIEALGGIGSLDIDPLWLEYC